MVTDSMAINAIVEKKAASAANYGTKSTWVLKYVKGSGVTQTMNIDSDIYDLEQALGELPAGVRFVGASHQTHSSVNLSKEASAVWTDVLGRTSTAVYTGIGG